MATTESIEPAATGLAQTRLRVGIAVPSSALRAALRLWLEETPGISLTFCLHFRIEPGDAYDIDVVVAELPTPTPTLHHTVKSFLEAGGQSRLTVLSFYAEAWRALVTSPRLRVLDLASLESEALGGSILGDHAVPSRRRRETRPDALLEDRDERILELVARGCKNSDIAGLLGVSSRTVQFRVSGLMRTMGVSSRAALMSRVPLAASAGRRREVQWWRKR